MNYTRQLNQLHDRYIRQRIAMVLLGIGGFIGFFIVLGVAGGVECNTMSLEDSFKPALFGLGLFAGCVETSNRLELKMHRTWRRIKKLSSIRNQTIAAYIIAENLENS